MTKKTKKEKRLADLRARNNLTFSQLNIEPQNTSQESAFFVKKDLTKSIILALLVLAFQLVLYWQLN